MKACVGLLGLCNHSEPCSRPSGPHDTCGLHRLRQTAPREGMNWPSPSLPSPVPVNPYLLFGMLPHTGPQGSHGLQQWVQPVSCRAPELSIKAHGGVYHPWPTGALTWQVCAQLIPFGRCLTRMWGGLAIKSQSPLSWPGCWGCSNTLGALRPEYALCTSQMMHMAIPPLWLKPRSSPSSFYYNECTFSPSTNPQQICLPVFSKGRGNAWFLL